MSDNFFLPGGIVDDDDDDVIAFGNPTSSVFNLSQNNHGNQGRTKSGSSLLGGEYYDPAGGSSGVSNLANSMDYADHNVRARGRVASSGSVVSSPGLRSSPPGPMAAPSPSLPSSSSPSLLAPALIGDYDYIMQRQAQLQTRQQELYRQQMERRHEKM
eukprot:CAMPEP_0118640128 /NCGR_PEP_ID=MMETSP0785-20121206/4589_1 /TAXON_ID=91992 /ORGANISM="Bolidomonas pacifica, Strain CCMP 1866" /LENGTH=157 /DNA_ID=CAMNT_0006531497 /DNA_START=79 /DNA_END=549 /DNA_ORIENTATION=-